MATVGVLHSGFNHLLTLPPGLRHLETLPVVHTVDNHEPVRSRQQMQCMGKAVTTPLVS